MNKTFILTKLKIPSVWKTNGFLALVLGLYHKPVCLPYA